MSRRRRSRGLVVLVAAIFTLLLAEAALVVFVFVSPEASERLGDAAEGLQRAWEGTDDEQGLRDRAVDRATDAYDNWIRPLYKDLDVPEVDPEFTACVECHKDYATRRRFTVYMNHPLHAELGLECVKCHPANPHPSPPRPQEKVCAECHTEVDEKEECGYCHPPASLPHFYYLGAPKASVVQCEVCHPKDAFQTVGTESLIETNDHSGRDPETCRACHETSTCDSCHEDVHPADWASTHGASALGADCTVCHTVTWCADRCHAVTDINPFYPKPMPSVGVRP